MFHHVSPWLFNRNAKSKASVFIDAVHCWIATDNYEYLVTTSEKPRTWTEPGDMGVSLSLLEDCMPQPNRICTTWLCWVEALSKHLIKQIVENDWVEATDQLTFQFPGHQSKDFYTAQLRSTVSSVPTAKNVVETLDNSKRRAHSTCLFCLVQWCVYVVLHLFLGIFGYATAQPVAVKPVLQWSRRLGVWPWEFPSCWPSAQERWKSSSSFGSITRNGGKTSRAFRQKQKPEMIHDVSIKWYYCMY